jgi:hypothetical protein
MNRVILFSLLAALVVVIGASHLHAGVSRWQCHRRPACVKQTTNAEHPSRTWSTFPTRTWDLGKHHGEWPQYHHKYDR